MDYILTTKQLGKIQLNDLHRIGPIAPNKYYNSLVSEINKSSLKISPAETGKRVLEHYKQKTPVTIGGRNFMLTMICNPLPQEKKEKPSGVVFDDDNSYLQVKELLFYDLESNELYSFEYSYHYGIWNFDDNNEKYYFRYDRDIFLKNPPKKKVEHFHVKFDKPHFNSTFVTFAETLQFIEDNWDFGSKCFELDMIS
jgi:hypothetical protein